MLILDKLKSKLGQDLIWNYISFGILAIAGISMDFIIAKLHGPEVLGAFNQVMAIYVIAAQFGVCGVQLSVLKHSTQYSENKNELNKIFSSAIVLSFLLGLFVFLIIFLSRNLMGYLLEKTNPELSKSIGMMSPAILFFALNKVLLFGLNGLRKMKAFAIGQALRYIMLVGFVVLISIINKNPYLIVSTFILTEFILFFVLLFIHIINNSFRFVMISKWDNWFKRHFVFGVKGFIGGILVETNARIDILMLGLFADDKIVGIYSLASRLGEGFYNLMVIVKNNLNPILEKLLRGGKKQEIRNLVKKTHKIVYPLALVIGIISIIIFPFFIKLIGLNIEFIQSRYILIILFSGIISCSGYIPFNDIMVQAGLPEQHTKFYLMTTITNIILNAILIPLIGMYGAAIGTALAFTASVIYINILVKKKLGIKLR